MGFKFYFPLIIFLLLSALAAFIGMIKYGNTYEVRKAKKKEKSKNLFIRLLRYIKGKEKYFIIAFIGMIVVVIFGLVQPLILGKVMGLLSEDEFDFNSFVWIIALLVVIIIVSSIVNYSQSIVLQKAGQKIIYEMREDVFNKIESLSIGQLNLIPVGKLVTRVTSDTMAINQMYTQIIISLIRNILSIVGVLIAMFIVNWELTLYVLMVAPLVIGFSVIFRYFSRKAHRNVRNSISNVNASLSENISGMKITQAFNQEEKQYNNFAKSNNSLYRNSFKEIFVFGIFRPSIRALYYLAVVIVLYVGSHKILGSNYAISFTVIVIFYQYIERFFTPIQQLADQFNRLQSAFAASERIFELLDTEPTVQNQPNSLELKELKGEIEFKNVWFAYENEDWVLKDVSFKINAKETVAFVGATGSGKTTILSLIARNYDIQKGQILIDGMDIKDIDIHSLRRGIGQMLQDVFLFSGTIKSNISLKDDSITEEEILEACKFVNADKIINKLPNGINEEVRERGNNFSAGERQLLSFARTVVHKPNIMILDEATANIDTETEVLIQESLNKMMNIGTMLIVAHRLSTIQHADNIIVLKHGRIIESGNHQELLKQGGYYYQLYKLQYQDQE